MSKEYQYNCLVYPNITYQKDFEKDSYFVIMNNLIRELRKVRNDTFFYLLVPEIMPQLQYDDTEQIIYRQPTYPNEMRQTFDIYQLKKLLDLENMDYDFVYCHLPEHNLQLENLTHNQNGFRGDDIEILEDLGFIDVRK